MKMDLFRARKEELENKEHHFKETVVKFDKFLKVNVIFLYIYPHRLTSSV
jgi:hypothetical protein